MGALFGPAGMCQHAKEDKIKSTDSFIKYISDKGLSAFEYQCGRGVNISDEKAALIGKTAEQYGISLSIHAPYYISLASTDPQKRDNSVTYILSSANAAKCMGAKRIVIHPGGIAKYTREVALGIACETMKKAVKAMDESGFSDIIMCPEVMGKINQLGRLEESIALANLDERMIPCVDFGHYNSYTMGGLNTKEAFAKVLDILEDKIGRERTSKLHVHFSKIEYSKGGEVKHLTFEDSVFGPEPDYLMELFAQRNMSPVVICESSGTQTDDSVTMMNMYKDAVK